jgi:hypothetical protein
MGDKPSRSSEPRSRVESAACHIPLALLTLRGIRDDERETTPSNGLSVTDNCLGGFVPNVPRETANRPGKHRRRVADLRRQQRIIQRYRSYQSRSTRSVRRRPQSTLTLTSCSFIPRAFASTARTSTISRSARLAARTRSRTSAGGSRRRSDPRGSASAPRRKRLRPTVNCWTRPARRQGRSGG